MPKPLVGYCHFRVAPVNYSDSGRGTTFDPCGRRGNICQITLRVICRDNIHMNTVMVQHIINVHVCDR